MSWNDIMRRVLPPVWDSKNGRYVPNNVTSPYGDTNRPEGSSNPHKGVDFNYYVGHDLVFNKSHPTLRSPVTGVVTNAGEGTVGRIAIRDTNGFSHEILHTYSRHVAVGDPVVAGQIIGTMGNTGVKGKNGKPGDPHVHYQLLDPTGKKIDPSAYWNEQGPIDPNPAPPAYLGDYQRYLRTPGAVGSPAALTGPAAIGSAQPFGTRRQFVPGSATSSRPLYETRSFVPPPDDTAATEDKNFRQLTRVWPQADLGGKNPNVPATIPNEMPPPDHAPSFAERFGNWTSLPSGSTPLLPPAVFGFPDPSMTPGDEPWSLQRLGRPTWNR